MDIAVDEIFIYIFTEFVTGKVSMAKNLIMDCVVVAQNQHTLAQLDKQSCSKLNKIVSDLLLLLI